MRLFKNAVAILAASCLFINSTLALSVGAVKYKTDGNWVDIKDDWRHGIEHENSGGSSGGGARKGHATGIYAVSLSDGDYYWYHQTSTGDGCTYCGDWTDMIWGNGGTFGADGCAIYSTSLILSNLTGQEITPTQWLQDIGCTINESHTNCDTSTSSCLSNHSLTAYSNILGVMEEKYGIIPCTEDMLGKSSDVQKQGVDETLDRGGMVWYRINGAYGSHYLTIRGKTSSGKYLCLDECVNPVNSDPEYTWDQIRAQLYSGGGSGVFQGFINPNAGSGGSGEIESDIGARYAAQIDLLNTATINPSQGLLAPIIGWTHPNWYIGALDDEDKQILDDFASEHFTDTMSPGEKACITWNWIHTQVSYPHGAAFNALEGVSPVKCIFRRRSGQCLQYNGAMVAMLLYLGFDAREVHGSRYRTSMNPGNGHDHYWCEVNVNGTLYLIDTGNSGDSGDIALTFFCETFEHAHDVDVSNGFGYYQEKGVIKDTTHTHSDWGSIR